MNKMDWNKIAAVAAGIGLVGAGVLGGFALDKPDTIVETQIVEVPLIEYVDVPGETVTVTETVVEQVMVEDVEFLQKICDRAMYEDISECKEEVSAEDAALKLALELLEDEKEVFDLLEDEGLINDEDEASIIRVYDDFEDVVIVKSDFEDQEYKFEVKVKVEDEDKDVKKYVWFKLGVEDGEAEILKVWE